MMYVGARRLVIAIELVIQKVVVLGYMHVRHR